MKKKNVFKASRLFSTLKNSLGDLKYENLPPEKRRQIEHDAEIDMPETRRLDLTKDQAVFIRHYDHGYTVKVFTGYIPDKNDFVPKDIYGIEITVVNMNNQKCYFRQIYRKGNFIQRAILEVQFIHHLLNHIPLDSKHARMVLTRDTYRLPIFRSVDGSEEKSILYLLPDDPKVREQAKVFWRGKRYYNLYGRKKRGVKKTISEIKQTSKVNNPNGL
jgi:hypothetical protein